MQTKFFIFDCQSNLVGNPAGYRTMRSAISQANRRNSTIHASLKNSFDNWVNKNPSESLRYHVKACEVQA